MVCVPVKGPWVVVPTAQSVPRRQVEYQLSCPRGYVVGGLDAELSNRAIDVSFLGKVGSPVNPGITTARSVVFVASYVGATARAPSFRPHVGCMPSSGGGRIPTAVRIVRPGQPTVRRVGSFRIRPGAKTVRSACRSSEVLVDASYAFAFRTRQPPSASVIGTVSGARRISLPAPCRSLTASATAATTTAASAAAEHGHGNLEFVGDLLERRGALR